MKTTDVPHLKEQSMAGTPSGKDSTTNTGTGKVSDNDPSDRASAGNGVEEATANPGEKRSTTRRPAAKDLAPAAESSDPAVHKVMAEMDAARMNGDDEALKAKQDELAELGYK